jgi:hypothetical protein
VDPTANQEQQKTAGVVQKNAVQEAVKAWSVWAIFETHFMVVRDNLPQNDIYHVLYLYGNYDVPRLWKIPPLGRFSLRLDVTRKYVADPDESGFLFGDLRLYYSRPIAFSIKGQDFGGRWYFYWTFPTSKVSGQEGNIARPTLLVSLGKDLPKGFSLLLRPFARLNWDRYAEAEGGAPNQRWVLGYDFWVMYTLPIHKRLSFGGIWGQDWYDKYAARDGGSQPWNSEYYWEVYTGYTLVEKPLTFDVNLSLTSGRKTIEDGVWRFHFVDRDETELYLSLRAFY